MGLVMIHSTMITRLYVSLITMITVQSLSADNVVSVYALRTNSWKRIENSPCDHSQHNPKSGVLVGGALHWIARNGAEGVIVALDLTDEKFRTMPSPCSLTGQLTVIRGGAFVCLLLVIIILIHIQMFG